MKIEQGAHIAHKQWSGWMKYLFENSIQNTDGTVTIPKWAVDRWTRQINTPYEELTEEEKESDRIEARKYLKHGLFHEWIRISDWELIEHSGDTYEAKFKCNKCDVIKTKHVKEYH
ncbi:hypothetical protein [Caproiciproducens sp.]